MRNLERSILAALFLTVLAWPVLASASYVESVNGDLSGDFQHPTAIAVAIGSTTVSGTVEGKGKGVSVDLDYFRVTIPAGQVLAELIVREVTQGGGMVGSFIAVFAGPTGVDPATAVSTDTLGYYLYGAGDVGNDILDNIGTFNLGGNNPSDGFTPPLPAGVYTFWIQEGFLGTFPYNFELVVQSAPAPSTLLLMGLAGLALGVWRLRPAPARRAGPTGR